MATPDTNIFIPDLPTDVDDAKLAEVFGQYGTVTWSKVMPSKGKSTLAGIVEFGDIEEAKWVVENLNGNLAQGISTPITVMFKRERSKGGGKGKDGGNGDGKEGGYGKMGGWTPGGKSFSPYSKNVGKGSSPYGGKDNGTAEAKPNTNIFVADLPADVDDAKLAEVFAQYGTVTWSKVMPSKGKPTAAGIVEFGDIAEATWVVENLNGNLAQGISTPITVMFKRERSKGGGKSKDGGNGNGKEGGYGKMGGWAPGGKSSSPYGKDGGKWPSPYGGKDNGTAEAKPNTNIFISDLPADVDDAKLAEVFGQYGTVTWSKVMPSKGKPTAAGIVEFGDIAEATWVVENLNGNLAQGISTPLNLAFKRERNKGDGKGKKGGKGGW